MMRDPLTTPADACTPDANRASTDVPAPLPEWVIHLLALVVHCMLRCMFAGRSLRSRLPSWRHARPDLPPGSAQEEAALIRGSFGIAIAWMCRRRGIGPGHPDWPYLSRTIVAFGGSVKRFRPGLPACGLQWWDNPYVTPGTIVEPPATPAADAMAVLESRLAADAALLSAPTAVPAAARHPLLPASWLSDRWPTDFWRLNSTGPPIGPPAIRVHQFSYA